MTASNNVLVRWDLNGSTGGMAAGSGMYSCEVWDWNGLGIFRANQAQLSPFATNWRFEQCSFLMVASKPLIDFNSTSGIANFYNCHFSGVGTSTQIVDTAGGGAVVAENCSYFDTGTQAQLDLATDTNPTPVTAEGFADKAGYDLHIDSATSNLYHSGGVAQSTSLTDRDGVAFDSPEASTGAYEG